jgi:competence ComEA-like helix-hairpin-helix protein
MNKEGVIILIIFLINFVSATCNSTQININTASLEELDKIAGVGSVIAQNIINGRQFNSIEDLLNVSRIGEVTLKKIKEQGLACIESDSEKNEKEGASEEEKETVKEAEIKNEEPEIISLNPIILNSANAKSIKSEADKESLKRNLSFYGLTAICLIFGALFLIKGRKRKNEFA